MGFPQLPFTLDKHSDKQLVQWAQEPGRFPFLRRATTGKLRRLERADLLGQGQRKLLGQLWPMVLTDALRTLKGEDSREVPKKGGRKGWKTFFHEGSLGVTQLRDVLNAFSEFESLLYGASPERYRDHVAHVFRVWIIGHALLTKQFGDRLQSNSKHCTIQPREWQCMWAIAALCHDLGYPLAAIERVNQRATEAFARLGLSQASHLKFSFSQQMLPFHDTIIRTMSSTVVEYPRAATETYKHQKQAGDKKKKEPRYLTHLQNKYYLKFLKSFDRLEHGVVSALLVSNALVYFLETDLSHDERSPLTSEDARQFLIRREILRAIASHTCQDIYHLKFNTLSLLLYLVDEIQCWGRPTFESFLHGGADSNISKVNIAKFSERDIQVSMTTSDGSWNRKKDRPKWPFERLENLHRMFRLAQDTRKHSRELRLDFSIGPQDGKTARFHLHDGKIDKTPKAWFQTGGNG